MCFVFHKMIKYAKTWQYVKIRQLPKNPAHTDNQQHRLVTNTQNNPNSTFVVCLLECPLAVS